MAYLFYAEIIRAVATELIYTRQSAQKRDEEMKVTVEMCLEQARKYDVPFLFAGKWPFLFADKWQGEMWIAHLWHQGKDGPFNKKTHQEVLDRFYEVATQKPESQRRARLLLMRLVSPKNQTRLAELYATYWKQRAELYATYGKQRADATYDKQCAELYATYGKQRDAVHREECPDLCCGWDEAKHMLPQFDTDE